MRETSGKREQTRPAPLGAEDTRARTGPGKGLRRALHQRWHPATSGVYPPPAQHWHHPDTETWFSFSVLLKVSAERAVSRRGPGVAHAAEQSGRAESGRRHGGSAPGDRVMGGPRLMTSPPDVHLPVPLLCVARGALNTGAGASFEVGEGLDGLGGLASPQGPYKAEREAGGQMSSEDRVRAGSQRAGDREDGGEPRAQDAGASSSRRRREAGCPLEPLGGRRCLRAGPGRLVRASDSQRAVT